MRISDFTSKNKLRAILILLMVGCDYDPVSMFENEFPRAIPDGSKLVHSEHDRFGPDACYLYEFQTPDDQLLDALLSEWRLNETSQPTSSYSKGGPAWWPSSGELSTMARKFEASDEIEQEYRSVWVDDGRIFVEIGSW